MQNLKFNTKINNTITADINIDISTDIAYGYGYGKLSGDFFHVFGIEGDLNGSFIIPTSTIIEGSSDWIWKDGKNGPDELSVYSGLPGDIGVMGARFFSCQWKDSDENIWVFGGNAFNEVNLTLSNDLWKYNQATKELIWYKKFNPLIVTGDYSQGIGNVSPGGPGARSGASFWTDSNGFFWLFGGFGHATTSSTGMLNDLWRFDPTLMEWRWMAGTSNIGSLGTNPLPNEGDTGIPRSRYRAATWATSDGKIWLFGGNTNLTNFILNDLWCYDTNTNQWTLVRKNGNGTNEGIFPPNYMDEGYPCSRDEAAFTVDGDDNLWLFGGRTWGNFGLLPSQYGSLNDFWKFDTTQNKWFLVSGTNIINNVNISDNSIPARVGSGLFELNGSNNAILLFGGSLSVNGGSYPESYSDFWSFSLTENKWRKIDEGTASSDSYPPNKDEKGYPSPRRGFLNWRNNNGDIAILGGQNPITMSVYNDVWIYNAPEKHIYGYGFEHTTNIIGQNRTKNITVEITPDIQYNSEFNVRIRIIGNGFSNSYTQTTVNHMTTFSVSDIYNPSDINSILRTLTILEKEEVPVYGYGIGNTLQDFFHVFGVEGIKKGFFKEVVGPSDVPGFDYGFGYEYKSIQKTKEYTDSYLDNINILKDKDTFFDIVIEVDEIKNENNIKITTQNISDEKHNKTISLKANIT